MIDPKTQEGIDWFLESHKRTVCNAITDDVMVQLFYAASGDITQFRIRGRKIIETAAAVSPLLSPEDIEPEPITPEMELVYSVWRQFKKDACVPGDDRVSEAFIKAARVLMGAAELSTTTSDERPIDRSVLRKNIESGFCDFTLNAYWKEVVLTLLGDVGDPVAYVPRAHSDSQHTIVGEFGWAEISEKPFECSYPEIWECCPLYAEPKAKAECCKGLAPEYLCACALNMKDSVTDEQIMDVWSTMPDGDKGFIKSWGYLQFARAVIAKFLGAKP